MLTNANPKDKYLHYLETHHHNQGKTRLQDENYQPFLLVPEARNYLYLRLLQKIVTSTTNKYKIVVERSKNASIYFF